ncbi:hypothetical protein GVY41_17120 [Frigidibacter albus]|uniref:Uncharacterized protein n=1 Tax=Frigidibacter albus TaxID=1465486 RepID=A0A6L8VN70_9RHOB|nr:hypothetical protein [Frigidibacter albus]MZQ90620.1 hypothetical protein [Frigidibacter albus]NBE32724.1 hypothetical protein [Frigidibacter albus]GGH60598.1 hypothetical protein GCM10011341_32980 [Frigidibacter albus]
MAKTITYQNNFDGSESLSGSLTVTLRPGTGPSNGTSTQIRDATHDNDADQELVLYDGTQVGGFV